MDNDIYKTPEANLDIEPEQSNELASRGSRLLASIVDSLVIMIVTLPLMYFTGGFDVMQTGIQPSWQYNVGIALAGLVFFVLVNTKLLLQNGQTIGKKALGIKIVDMDGMLPSLTSHLLPRYATYFLPGQVPVIGQLFAIINVLFIFGSQKRCVHDLAAGTKVVRC